MAVKDLSCFCCSICEVWKRRRVPSALSWRFFSAAGENSSGRPEGKRVSRMSSVASSSPSAAMGICSCEAFLKKLNLDAGVDADVGGLL